MINSIAHLLGWDECLVSNLLFTRVFSSCSLQKSFKGFLVQGIPSTLHFPKEGGLVDTNAIVTAVLGTG